MSHHAIVGEVTLMEWVIYCESWQLLRKDHYIAYHDLYYDSFTYHGGSITKQKNNNIIIT